MHNYTTQTEAVARIFGYQNKVDHISYPADIKMFYSLEPRFKSGHKHTHRMNRSTWTTNVVGS